MSTGDESNVGEFLAEAEEILEAIADGLLSLEAEGAGGDPDPEVINAVFRGAHSLKGISAMCGFVQITEVSHKMETLLDALRMGKVPCEVRVVSLLLNGVDLLKRLCSRLAEGEAPEDDQVPSFVEQLLAAAEQRGGAENQGLEEVGLGPEALQVLTEYEVHRLQETLKNPKRRLVRVSTSFPVESFDTDLEGLNEALKACGEIISTLPRPEASSPDRLDFDLLVGAKVPVQTVHEVAEPFGGVVEALGGGGDWSGAHPEFEPAGR